MKYIVRADYYSNGDIVPIGLTDEHGSSYIIRNVENRINMKTGETEYKCIINERKITLIFHKNRWHIKDLEMLDLQS